MLFELNVSELVREHVRENSAGDILELREEVAGGFRKLPFQLRELAFHVEAALANSVEYNGE